MQVIVELPDEIAEQLGERGQVQREFLEAFVAERYRAGQLSRHQVRRLLDLDYWQTEEFLNQHQARRPYTLDDLEIDRQSLATLPQK